MRHIKAVTLNTALQSMVVLSYWTNVLPGHPTPSSDRIYGTLEIDFVDELTVEHVQPWQIDYSTRGNRQLVACQEPRHQNSHLDPNPYNRRRPLYLSIGQKQIEDIPTSDGSRFLYPKQ